MKPRFVVMVSGNGTNLQVLVDAVGNGTVEASIVLVIASNIEAYALKRAEAAGIPTLAMPYRRDPTLGNVESRRVYDRRIAELILPYKPDYIFLLGWMRVLSGEFIKRFPGKILNLHPALPGAFPGTHAIERAWDACARGEISESGVMVHSVPDEGVDSGPVIDFERVAMWRDESLDAFEERMHSTEHALVVRAATRLVSAIIPGTKENY
ncbi:MAG: phosphoribosylglycinamide formyltransferase [Spirochaetae bacterium HGW-Spirochaetae-9]|nr:MAG: phosphoribosylglycinamide formyltransferase [Spirochaetae bacterium HGW-Spirochaetae-9]